MLDQFTQVVGDIEALLRQCHNRERLFIWPDAGIYQTQQGDVKKKTGGTLSFETALELRPRSNLTKQGHYPICYHSLRVLPQACRRTRLCPRTTEK